MLLRENQSAVMRIDHHGRGQAHDRGTRTRRVVELSSVCVVSVVYGQHTVAGDTQATKQPACCVSFSQTKPMDILYNIMACALVAIQSCFITNTKTA
jgi:hypothetical protein